MGKEIEAGESRETWRTDSSRSVDVQDVSADQVVEPKKPWWHPIKEPGSAAQIVISAVVAIAIGLAVTSTVDSVPEACTEILGIPGTTWLRALRATGKSQSIWATRLFLSHELIIAAQSCLLSSPPSSSQFNHFVTWAAATVLSLRSGHWVTISSLPLLLLFSPS